MSNLEQKVEVVTEWLQRTARLQRVTNPYEVRVAAGLGLAEKGYRESGSARALSEDQLTEVLVAVAKQSFDEDEGLILPALMIHFGDKKPSSRFVSWAVAVGLIDPDAVEAEGVDSDEIEALAAQQIAKIHKHYASVSA
jgi:hypothetical protein